MSIKIRTKVATLLGYENIQREGVKLTGWRNGHREELPKYESSLDDIYGAFEEMRISFRLNSIFSKDADGLVIHRVSSPCIGDSTYINRSASIAMCYLLINTLEGTDVSKP